VVVPGALWRGAKPDAPGAAALISLGVRTVVNLELLDDDRDAFRMARPSTPVSTSIDYFRIRDWEPNVVIAPALLDSHVSAFMAIVKTQAKPIYVHCRSGQNRTGVMIAAYRVMLEGASIESAIDEMRRYQGAWFKQDAEYLRGLIGEHRARIEKMTESRIGQIQREARLECSASGCNER
jgi:tyrosine-protein phosphatase SIW14